MAKIANAYSQTSPTAKKNMPQKRSSHLGQRCIGSHRRLPMAGIDRYRHAGQDQRQNYPIEALAGRAALVPKNPFK